MAKYEWKPIEEMDMEDGTHTCYSTTIHYNCGDIFWWCTQTANGTWDVEWGRPGSDYIHTEVNCKTLASAKRWVARYA